MAEHVLLGIFPHPDDEAYAAGGAIALATASGARAVVLSATNGERGQRFHRPPGDQLPLGELRAAELACSCRVLGAEPRLLGYADGALSNVNFPCAVAAIVRLIREIRPHVVVTLGPDGAYGHPDHVALHRLVVAAIPSAAGGDRFPEERLGPAHRVARLFFAAFPPGLFRPQYEKMLTGELAPALRFVDPNRLGAPETEIAAVVPIAAVAERKLAALACHRSQYDGDDPRAIFPAGIVDRLLERELFTLAGARPSSAPLADLFEGL